MYLVLFLEGLAIGFLLATPIGPIGILCVQRTLTNSRRHGLIVGLSGASADIVYALIAACGVTLISNFIREWQFWIRLGSGIILFILGIYILHSDPMMQAKTEQTNVMRKTFVPTFLLALTNPMSLFGFGAVFSGIGIWHTAPTRISLFVLVAGVFFGSLLWFSLLANVTYVLKKKLTGGGLAIANRIAGMVFILLGAVTIWSCIHRL